MKKVLALFAMVFVVVACNLTSKLRSNSNSSNSGSSTGTSSTDGEEVEKPQPNSAQQAIIAGGQTVNWGQQGITWTLPPDWKKNDIHNESLSYGGNGAFLTVAISVMPQMESYVDTSIKAMYEAAKTQQKIGKYDEVKWLELDGLKGVEFRESKQEDEGDIRRLEWQAYRKFAGNTQLITMILSTDSGQFAKHEDELYAIMYSTKVVH
jgi:hypothetical protein